MYEHPGKLDRKICVEELGEMRQASRLWKKSLGEVELRLRTSSPRQPEFSHN